uniref:Uncharacterized protein n=1 Tax=Tetraselmis sp. GSL018 TaxID=582737 RepID=A0A061QG51_9CHLO
MDWEGFAVPRQGGVILESFVTDEVNSMPENQREAAAQQLGTRVSDAICTAQAKVQTNMTEIKHGCSPTGCPIGKYGHQLEREAEEKKMLEPDHPLGASLLLKESLQHPETSSWHPG